MNINCKEYQICGPDIMFDNNLNPFLFELNSNFPSFVMRYDPPEIRKIKKNIRDTISNNLFNPVLNNKEIDLENYGFIKLL